MVRPRQELPELSGDRCFDPLSTFGELKLGCVGTLRSHGKSEEPRVRYPVRIVHSRRFSGAKTEASVVSVHRTSSSEQTNQGLTITSPRCPFCSSGPSDSWSYLRVIATELEVRTWLTQAAHSPLVISELPIVRETERDRTVVQSHFQSVAVQLKKKKRPISSLSPTKPTP